VDGRTQEHTGQLSTVIIEPDDRRLILVWQTVLPVRSNIDYLDETLVTERGEAR
jgi:hypothetical protein